MYRICRGIVPGALLFALLAAGNGHAQNEDAAESLYDRLGGLPAISVLLSNFIDDFVADTVIMANPAVRERKNAESMPYLKFQLTALVCEVTGGPCEYTGASLHDAHEGLDITAAEWDRMVEIFSRSLSQHGVGEREQQELFEIIGPTRSDIVLAGTP